MSGWCLETKVRALRVFTASGVLLLAGSLVDRARNYVCVYVCVCVFTYTLRAVFISVSEYLYVVLLRPLLL